MNIEELILKLIETIENLAPEVWRVLLKQTYAEAFAKLIWGFGLAILAYKLFEFTKRYIPNKLETEAKKEDTWEQEDIWKWEKIIGLGIVCGLVVLLAAYQLSSAIMWLYNPEFYAIRFLLWQVK